MSNYVMITNSGSLSYSALVGLIFGPYVFLRYIIYHNYTAANTNYSITSLWLDIHEYFESIRLAVPFGFACVWNNSSTAIQCNIGIVPSANCDDLSKIYVGVQSSATGTYLASGTLLLTGTRK